MGKTCKYHVDSFHCFHSDYIHIKSNNIKDVLVIMFILMYGKRGAGLMENS